MIGFLINIIMGLIWIIIRLIGKFTFFRINKNDKVYLKNYYDECFSIDGNLEFAKQMTDIERKKIKIEKQSRFLAKLSSLFG